MNDLFKSNQIKFKQEPFACVYTEGERESHETSVNCMLYLTSRSGCSPLNGAIFQSLPQDTFGLVTALRLDDYRLTDLNWSLRWFVSYRQLLLSKDRGGKNPCDLDEIRCHNLQELQTLLYNPKL